MIFRSSLIPNWYLVALLLVHLSPLIARTVHLEYVCVCVYVFKGIPSLPKLLNEAFWLQSNRGLEPSSFQRMRYDESHGSGSPNWAVPRPVPQFCILLLRLDNIIAFDGRAPGKAQTCAS